MQTVFTLPMALYSFTCPCMFIWRTKQKLKNFSLASLCVLGYKQVGELTLAESKHTTKRKEKQESQIGSFAQKLTQLAELPITHKDQASKRETDKLKAERRGVCAEPLAIRPFFAHRHYSNVLLP